VWHEDPLGQLGPVATCRGCGKGLWARGVRWSDQDGFEVCVKAALGDIGHGPQAWAPVLHEPMPVGLRGAPAV